MLQGLPKPASGGPLLVGGALVLLAASCLAWLVLNRTPAAMGPAVVG